MNKPTTTCHLVGTGRYIPPKVMTNNDFEKILDTTDEWIVSHTGIKRRHIADQETTSDLATKAALNALEKSGYDKEKIDLIIVATVTPDQVTPSTSNIVQAKLGLNHKPIMCFDVNAACTGFIYSLDVAMALLASKRVHSALVIGVESLSKVCDYKDRNTCILFGDGAGAVLIERGSSNEPAYVFSASQGDMEKTLTIDRYIHMNGPKVYRFAVTSVEASIRKALADTQLALSDITKFIPHQANLRIIASVANSLGLPLDAFYINLEEYGNTSGASIPIALDEYLDLHPRQPGQHILMVGFGGGLTWGSAIITL